MKVVDNRKTMKRELWVGGKLAVSISAIIIYDIRNPKSEVRASHFEEEIIQQLTRMPWGFYKDKNEGADESTPSE